MMKRFFLFAFLTNYYFLSFSQDIKYPNSLTDGQYYTVNGAKLWVVTVGKGEPLILISGGPGGAHPGLRRFDSLVKSNIQLIYFAKSFTKQIVKARDVTI